MRIGSTFTDHGASLRTIYVFAYADSASHSDLNVSASELGVMGKTFMYNFFTGTGREIDLHHPFTILTAADAWSYNVFVPISKNGIALIGDTGKFVTCGKQRIAKLKAAGSGIKATILFARGERTVTLCGHAPRAVAVEVTGGSVVKNEFNSLTDLFSFEIHPSENLRYRSVDGDMVAEIPLTIFIR